MMVDECPRCFGHLVWARLEDWLRSFPQDDAEQIADESVLAGIAHVERAACRSCDFVMLENPETGKRLIA